MTKLKIILISCALFTLLALSTSCKKKELNGTVLITLVNQGQTIETGTVYMKKGSSGDPGLPLSGYDQAISLDAQGLAIFENLEADTYYFFALHTSNSHNLTGSSTVQIVSRKAEGSYDKGSRFEKKIYLE